MKNLRYNIIKILGVILAFVLASIALLSFFALMPFSLVFTIIRSIKKEGVYKALFDFFFIIGKGIDQTSNGSYKHVLNGLMLKDISNYHAFGSEDETISSVLGRNQQYRTLSWFGWLWVLILWLIDVRYWFKGGHCKNSIGE